MKCAHEWPFARRSQTEIKSKTKTEHKYKYIKEICLAKEPGGTEAGLATERLTAGAVKQSRVSECSRLSGGVRRKGRGRKGRFPASSALIPGIRILEEDKKRRKRNRGLSESGAAALSVAS